MVDSDFQLTEIFALDKSVLSTKMHMLLSYFFPQEAYSPHAAKLVLVDWSLQLVGMILSLTEH